MDYSKTVYLPKTEFPMKANLSHKEPEILKFWEKIEIYKKIIKKNKGKKEYILHDGPPYANGHIHLGTALNKILKDIVVKYKSLSGFYSPFKPGWDCHGMPIEHQVFKEIGKNKNEVDILEFRKRASEFAKKFVEIQKNEFKRLGIFGEWENPYLTLSPDYESDIIKAFGKLYLSGYIYQTYKPIYWCIICETALAEAEIEYYEKKSPSIFVKFKIIDDKEKGMGENSYFLIWTTTPWTLPGNTGIMVHPDFKYVLVEFNNEKIIIAEKRKEEIEKIIGKNLNILKEFKGKELEGIICKNPLLERKSRVVLSEFVSGEEGTGCVHTAPGHGEEDYYVGIKNGLPILSPVNEKGEFTEEIEEFKGINVFKADPVIIEKLKNNNFLLSSGEITHSYPFCWRCKNPVIYRSTKQWFLKIDHNNLRQRMLEEIKKVKWVPPEGINRISSMVSLRPDWCLSRQRLWGVFIPVFYCKNCNNSVITEETIEKIYNLVKEFGSNVWIEKKEEEILPEGFKCPFCGSKSFKKELDILDVWFDSGVSHLAVLKEENNLKWPSDLYLEGSDQHRGWFQTSLIVSCGIFNSAPYRNVLTHGFVVDGEGRKMSKSLGNVITPEQIIKNYGAEILRLWSVYENYQEDIRISDEIIKNIVKSYRVIRNTIRFLLGNIYDYKKEDEIPYEKLFEVDKLAVEKLKVLVKKVTEYYENFAFNKAFEEIYNFCNIFLSSFYLDYLKDRLYTYSKNSIERKAGQTVLNKILNVLLILISPILSFTAEEAYQFIPYEKKESIFLEDWPKIEKEDENLLKRWDKFFEIRKIVLKKIEEKREQKLIGSSLETKVIIKCDKENFEFLNSFYKIQTLFIVSEVEIQLDKKFDVKVEKTNNKKCQRCWIYFPEIGKDSEFPDLCEKCIKVIKKDFSN
ncbi:MAG: isoleucine--tRNA ligase [Candidatus Omnitrophica bacterium]|nr:isoleucine--tRNA ligase [Candidatus Omnitrophota bacterium]MCM8811139.1 isoleucine--tRNA ligase [Candidatus Omnitrophota bacterium]